MPDIPTSKIHPHPKAQEATPPQPSTAELVPPFIEWCAISNFSFLRGASHPEELVQRAASLGYRGIAIADINTLAGIVRAYHAAKQHGLRCFVGAQLVLYRELPALPAEETSEDLPPEILPASELLIPLSLFVFPKDRAGYAELSRLLTTGKRRAKKGRCFLTIDDLPEHCERWLGILDVRDPRDRSLQTFVPSIAHRFSKESRALALWRDYGPDADVIEHEIQGLAAEHDLALVATNRPLYHAAERNALQDVLTCIRRSKTIDEAGHHLRANAERHLKPPREMVRLFRNSKAAIRRTLDFAEQISFQLSDLRYEYPHEICPENQSVSEYLRELTWAGARDRYPQGVPEKVRGLLEHELQLVAELRYEQYFLTVYDIVRFARSIGILCQGRGAAANSAICYCLGITSVDPDQIRLLVERFISKERNEPPDIDIDFEHERREEVIQYIYRRFGRHRAALVCEVISYRTRLALRDIGKVFALSSDSIEKLIALVTRSEGEPLSAEQLQRYGLDAHDRAITLTLDLMQQLKGFPRHLSQHVGGFVITEGRLDELCPIENAGMPDRTTIEWDKDDIDVLGMLKIDVLALGMLTCIRKAFSLLNERRAQDSPPIELHTVPQEDPAVYDMLCAADTVGVFQIESRAQMSMLPRLRPRTFYDLVIEVAIVRPGPIQGGMVHPFLRRRSGQEQVTFPDDRIRQVLERTLGVPIFQEQAMELAVVAAGFTPGESDQLRRAMASWKKNKNLLRGFETRLIGGMLKNGYSRSFAEQCFQQICGFGEYGFPQSHAASFALLVYVSSWIKKHHPAVFAAALINSQPMGFYQPAQIVEDAKRHGVEVREIDLLSSRYDCTLEGPTSAVRLGLRLIRGMGEQEAERVVDAVSDYRPFRSLHDLWRRTTLPVSTLRKLASADALRSLGLNRQQALWELKRFRDERLPLFEKLHDEEASPTLPDIPALQEMIADYHAAQLSLKSHPLSFLRTALQQRGAVSSADLGEDDLTPDGKQVLIAGTVLVRQRPGTASGIVFLTLEDEWGMINLVVFADLFKRYRSALSDYPIVLVRGKVQRADGTIHIIVSDAHGIHFTTSQQLPSLSRDFH